MLSVGIIKEKILAADGPVISVGERTDDPGGTGPGLFEALGHTACKDNVLGTLTTGTNVERPNPGTLMFDTPTRICRTSTSQVPLHDTVAFQHRSKTGQQW